MSVSDFGPVLYMMDSKDAGSRDRKGTPCFVAKGHLLLFFSGCVPKASRADGESVLFCRKSLEVRVGQGPHD